MSDEPTLNALENQLRLLRERINQFANQARTAVVVQQEVSAFVREECNCRQLQVVEEKAAGTTEVLWLKFFNLSVMIRTELFTISSDKPPEMEARIVAYVNSADGKRFQRIGSALHIANFSSPEDVQIKHQRPIFCRQFITDLLQALIMERDGKDPQFAIVA